MAGRKTRKKRRKARVVPTVNGLPSDAWKAYLDGGGCDHLPLEDAPGQIRADFLRWTWLSVGASLFGYWRDCPFPVCRRHRKCLAEYWPKDEPSLTELVRPPCCHGQENKYQRLITWMHKHLPEEEDDAV
ncbi:MULTISPECIES: hypothetical protein [Alphaproteobacteria]|uniref:Uncharacterized protein n=2 Tax=Alphaproteobacteria TaxID=28211 RepID=A0A512HDI1_9HYPH|nr:MULTISPECIES: hypothetical protein [Alphaproteobacteria]GEO83512.1 hypothetical protein RNA01_04440 [Ciceribacter naphthalenivorans]GLR24337.1 hypothetical protein GCM10007920_41310 [Ciceribacter naphthalenivorans]GLT07193.1 hypothetical protein GCM10007926_41310 [Sphingomonas psychrolutea]